MLPIQLSQLFFEKRKSGKNPNRFFVARLAFPHRLLQLWQEWVWLKTTHGFSIFTKHWWSKNNIGRYSACKGNELSAVMSASKTVLRALVSMAVQEPHFFARYSTRKAILHIASVLSKQTFTDCNLLPVPQPRDGGGNEGSWDGFSSSTLSSRNLMNNPESTTGGTLCSDPAKTLTSHSASNFASIGATPTKRGFALE